ncbi:MAG: PAS domain-containing protein [Desulfobacterales bacterium]|nr:PAS domain-containing protein [Desulfobacterales bacterium]
MNTESTTSDISNDSDESNSLDDFYDNLQDLVLNQAKKILNMEFYTRALLSSLPLALLATDEIGNITTINQTAERLLEISQKQAKGKPLWQCFPNQPDIEKVIQMTLQQGNLFHMGSKKIILFSGKSIIVNLYFQALLDDEKQIYGILLTMEDMTDYALLKNALKQYVPASVSEMIANDKFPLELGGEQKELTVLFSDLIGFTSYSEKFPPEDMVKLLSEYFNEMTEKIFEFNGTLKEYVGDEIMAIFGAPVEQMNHAHKACSAGLAMKQKLGQLREEWTNQGKPPLRARVGINTGRMLVGNLGSRYRFSYGVLGDHVNLGSRLEGLNNLYGTEILLGENTADLVHDAFQLREIDHVKVKGRQQPVRIYELISDESTPLSDKDNHALTLYANGLKSYRLQLWDQAIEHFNNVLEIWQNDGPAKVMKERCYHYISSPPPEKDQWDGVFQHIQK